MKKLYGAALALLGMVGGYALAQVVPTVELPAGYAPSQAVGFGSLHGLYTPVDEAHGLPVADRAFRGETAMVVGSTYTARRSLKVACTAAGNVAVTYADGSTGIWAVQTGTQTLPISVTSVNASGTTATCTYANLT